MLNHIRNAALGALAVLALAAPASAQSCQGDIAQDGRVDGGDLGLVLANWGPVSSSAVSRACDLNNDNVVSGIDLGILLGSWGACPIIVPTWAELIEATPDPQVVTSASLRASISATRYAWRVRDRQTQIEFLLVPPGTFQMGCQFPTLQSQCTPQEFPVHEVTLTNPFYLGRFEVTQSQWQAQRGSNPSFFQSPSPEVPASDVPKRPVDSIPWNLATEFASALGMRLPTEAEWEYACRAGTRTAFHSAPGFPNGISDEGAIGIIAWCNLNAGTGGQTHPVGMKGGNALGFHDMHGNAWEWVSDWLDFYPTGGAPQTNPTGPSQPGNLVWRAYRGGSTESRLSEANCSYRFGAPPINSANERSGFRVARNP